MIILDFLILTQKYDIEEIMTLKIKYNLFKVTLKPSDFTPSKLWDCKAKWLNMRSEIWYSQKFGIKKPTISITLHSSFRKTF